MLSPLLPHFPTALRWCIIDAMKSKKQSKELIYADVTLSKRQERARQRAGKAAAEAFEHLDDYDHNLFRAFLIAFIRTGVLAFVCVTVYKNINRSNMFFAIFVPIMMFFISSVFKYCYRPKMGTPYVLNMAFFYSGVTIVLFNVFTHNSAIGLLSTKKVPGAIIAIGPCMGVFFLIYMLAMKLDVSIMGRIRAFVGKTVKRKPKKS